MFSNRLLALFLLGLLPGLGSDLFAQGWQWQNPLPTGNRLYCLEFVDSLTGWFGSSAGTILHTVDGGKTWEIQYTGIADFYFESIDFIDHQEGWATGRRGFGGAYVLHTTDGGKNWTVQFVYESPTNSVIVFEDSERGWLGTGGGEIYYTLDGGEVWELGYTGRGEVKSIVFLDTLRGWAEGQGMPLLYTEDGGRSWRADTTGIIGAKVFFLDSVYGWIGSLDRVLRTVDGGKSWLDDLSRITGDEHALVVDLFFVDTLSGWVQVWEKGIYRTTDGGRRWELLSKDLRERLFGDLYFFTPKSGWIGFSRTWDGGKTLVYQKRGFTLSTLWDVDFIDEHTGWVVGSDGVIAKSTDGGESWDLQESGTADRFNSVFALNERRVWAVGLKGVIAQTKDGGESWESKYYTVGISTAHRAVTFIDSIKGWIAGDYMAEDGIKGFILYTDDGGESWVELSHHEVAIGDVTFVNEDEGWALGAGGIIYHTVDGGKSWDVQLRGGPDSEIVFVDENTGWASGVWPGRVWGTTNGGETWKLLFTTRSSSAAGMDFINKNQGWIAGILGYIWKTGDGGRSWQRQKSGTANALRAVDFVNENEGWIVGDNGTVLHTTTGGITDVEMNFASHSMPENFHLFPNYPNPFNSRTVISYVLPQRGHVSVRIYDLLGKEVITLVDGVQSSGVHRVIWDGKGRKGGDMPGGIYFYRLQFEGVPRKTGKMILLR